MTTILDRARPSRADAPADAAGDRRPLWPLLTALVSIPLIVAVVLRVGQQVVPVGDLAITDLAVRDVSHGHLTLLGPYSRYGWNHPGPAMFILMAPFQWLSGGAAWGTILGANVLKALGLGLSLREAERLGGRAWSLATAVVLALALAPLGAEFAIDPWNPWIAVVYLPATVLGAAAVLSGHRRALLPLAFSTSLMVQSHVGFAPLVAVLGLAAVGLFGIDRTVRRRVLDAGPWRGALLSTSVLIVVMWVGPAWDAVFGRRNLQAMYHYFTSPNAEDLVGNRRALGLVGVEFHWLPPWLGGANPKEPIDGSLLPTAAAWALPAVALVAGVLLVALLVRRIELRATAVLVAATTVAILVSLPRVTLPVRSYLFPYRSMVPLALLAVLLAGAWARFGPRPDADADADADAEAEAGEPTRPDRGLPGGVPVGAAVAIGAVVLVLFPSFTTARSVTDVPVRARNEKQVSVAAHALERVYRQRDGTRPVVVASLGFALHGWDATLLNEMDRNGISLLVPEDQGFKFSDRRSVTPAQAKAKGATETWWIIEEGDLRAEVIGDPGVTLLYRTENLPRAEQEELDALYVEVNTALLGAGRPDLARDVDAASIGQSLGFKLPGWEQIVSKATIDRLGELNAKAEKTGCQCAVVATPIGAPAPG